MRVQFVKIVPTLRQRKAESLSGATYASVRMPGLRRPLMKFPPGMYPFGRELDHLTDEQLLDSVRAPRSTGRA